MLIIIIICLYITLLILFKEHRMYLYGAMIVLGVVYGVLVLLFVILHWMSVETILGFSHSFYDMPYMATNAVLLLTIVAVIGASFTKGHTKLRLLGVAWFLMGLLVVIVYYSLDCNKWIYTYSIPVIGIIIMFIGLYLFVTAPKDSSIVNSTQLDR